MVLRLTYGFVERGFRWLNPPSDRRRLLAERAYQRRVQEREAERKEREEQEDADDTLHFAIAADASRQVVEALNNDIADAIRATRLVYERAQLEQEAALRKLELAQRNAITLADGRRLYFTDDGRHLFGEDLQEITDGGTVAAARAVVEAKPGATTYETYVEQYRVLAQATQRAEQLADTLEQLDDLRERMVSGDVAPDELAQRQKDFDTITAELPEIVRQDYERLRTDRIRNLEHELEAQVAPDPKLHADFARANEVFTTEVETRPDLGEDSERAPAYKPAPDF